MGTIRRKQKPIFARNVVAHRKRLKLSGQALAEKAKIPYPTLRDIEAGYNHGREETRTAIAGALGVTMADLYRDESKEAQHPNPLHFDPGPEELARILHALMHAEPVTRLSALLLLTGDKSYSDQLRAIPGGAPFALVLSKLLR